MNICNAPSNSCIIGERCVSYEGHQGQHQSKSGRTWSNVKHESTAQERKEFFDLYYRFGGLDLAYGPDLCVEYQYDIKNKTISNLRTMNQQPDTTTLAGKIAVMTAAQEGKRIDSKGPHDPWGICTPYWDWENRQYRIHPDDLNPPPKPTYRPWTSIEVPLGKVIIYRHRDKRCRILLTSTDVEGLRLSSATGYGIWVTYETLLSDYILENGTPCGTLEAP